MKAPQPNPKSKGDTPHRYFCLTGLSEWCYGRGGEGGMNRILDTMQCLGSPIQKSITPSSYGIFKYHSQKFHTGKNLFSRNIIYCVEKKKSVLFPPKLEKVKFTITENYPTKAMLLMILESQHTYISRHL